jgi:hypothetical protein
VVRELLQSGSDIEAGNINTEESIAHYSFQNGDMVLQPQCWLYSAAVVSPLSLARPAGSLEDQFVPKETRRKKTMLSGSTLRNRFYLLSRI